MTHAEILHYLELEAYHFWRIGKRRMVIAEIVQVWNRRTGLRILDIGGPISFITASLPAFGITVCADPDESAAEFGRNEMDINVQWGELPDLPEWGVFDLITLFDVLEHVEDHIASLAAIRNQLKPGGYLIMTVPAYQWMFSSHDAALGHHRRYTARRLREMLDAAGFEIERLTYWTTLLFPLMAAQRLASKLLRRKGGYQVNVPPRPVNWLCLKVMDVERWLLRFINLPFGGSIFAVCKKKG